MTIIVALTVSEWFKSYSRISLSLVGTARCCAALCLATSYASVETLVGATFERKYTVRVNRACCGRVSNCCAPTCCNTEAIYDILDPAGESLAPTWRLGVESIDTAGYAFVTPESCENLQG